MFTQDQLDKLNTLTKYPSIPTYHEIQGRGSLGEKFLSLGDEKLFLTEKVDGTNTRVIMFPEGYFFIGSREELLYFSEDLLYNPSMGITKALLDRGLPANLLLSTGLRVYYFETYGGKIGRAAKQYTRSAQVDFRLFDIRDLDLDEVYRRLKWDLAKISSHREAEQDGFLSVEELRELENELPIQLVPYLSVMESIPQSREECLALLQSLLPSSGVGIDHVGKAEGVVVRTNSRDKIVKMRFEDYEKTLRRK